jgi:hypothetical protein
MAPDIGLFNDAAPVIHHLLRSEDRFRFAVAPNPRFAVMLTVNERKSSMKYGTEKL